MVRRAAQHGRRLRLRVKRSVFQFGCEYVARPCAYPAARMTILSACSERTGVGRHTVNPRTPSVCRRSGRPAGAARASARHRQSHAASETQRKPRRHGPLRVSVGARWAPDRYCGPCDDLYVKLCRVSRRVRRTNCSSRANPQCNVQVTCRGLVSPCKATGGLGNLTDQTLRV